MVKESERKPKGKPKVKEDGHRAGTGRAPGGYRAGTGRAPGGHRAGTGRGEAGSGVHRPHFNTLSKNPISRA